MCKFTVIMAVRNRCSSVRRAVDSFLKQTYAHKEMIVVDGASDDGTLEILREYGPQIRLTSERDSGVYEALNKGIDAATGNWIFFLGSDDSFWDDHVLEDVAARLSGSSLKLLYGDVYQADGRIFRSRLDWRTLAINTVHHQAAFYHRSLFERFRYRTDIRVVGDYELNFLCWWHRVSHAHFDRLISRYALSGLSHQTDERRNYADTFVLRSGHINPALNFFGLSVAFINLARRRMLRAR